MPNYTVLPADIANGTTQFDSLDQARAYMAATPGDWVAYRAIGESKTEVVTETKTNWHPYDKRAPKGKEETE